MFEKFCFSRIFQIPARDKAEAYYYLFKSAPPSLRL